MSSRSGQIDTAESAFAKVTEVVHTRLAQNKRVRRNLPGGGRLRIDRQLPFLCLYRKPAEADPGTRELVTTEAAYLFASGKKKHHGGLAKLCAEINQSMQEHFGTYLLLEIWSEEVESSTLSPNSDTPGFTIVADENACSTHTIESFRSALEEISIRGQSARVETRESETPGPPDLPPLVTATDDAKGGCHRIGLAVKPIYHDPSTGKVYPIVLHQLRHQLAVAIRKTIAHFTGTADDDATQPNQSDSVPFHSLGPSSLVKAARLVDQQLCDVSESFDFLLQVTPTNADDAKEQFIDGGFKSLPRLRYRPLPYHPNLLKRELFTIEIERIEDPTLADICWEKQEEVAHRLTALRNLDTPDFLYSSMQLYGKPGQSLVKLAHEIVSQFPESNSCSDETRCVSASDFVTQAREEIDHYHQQMNEFNASVEICNEIAAGVMVSHDRLLIAKNVNLTPSRVEALLHHEIGTHLLTYFNGRCQPFRQLYAGLAGYEELQEGLAVLAEYLAGGLTVNRMRTLAGRVLAVDSLVEGNSFGETFALLHDEFQFSQGRAFSMALRVYRGGGLTKDVIYLRGLRDLLDYLSAGHDIEPLYVGKIGLQHVASIQEMRLRKIVVPPRILPRLWDDDSVHERLDACRGKSVLQLMEPSQ